MRTNKAAIRTAIPWAMAAARAALGPVLAAGAACQWNGLALAGIVLAALLSDIFDGVLARRWGCDTAGVRLFDTLADTFFYGWTAAALWLAAPAVWRENAALLVAVLTLELLHFLFDLSKFGKPASYHSYLAKTWGLVLASAVIGAFALGRSNVLVPVALGLGVACKLEGLAMSLLLREWRQDVKTLAVAWRLRGAVPGKRLGRRAAATLALMLMMVTLLMTRSSFAAVEGNEVSYVGGTNTLTVGTLGTLDLTAPTSLIFLGKTPGIQVVIPYAQMTCFTYETELTHHLGVLPAIAVGLLRTRKHRHFVTLEYTDGAKKQQVMVLEVAKDVPRVVVPLLSEKVTQRCSMVKPPVR